MPTITADEYLIVNGVPLATPAYRIDSLAPLHQGRDLRGEDRLIPGAVGVRARRRRATVTVLTFGLHVYGIFDKDGVAYADARQGLDDNTAYLNANLGAGSATGDGTVPVIWHQPNATELSVNAHVLGPHDPEKMSPTWLHFMLDLSVPSGWFA